jgi:tRNA (adenine57-N1/adenine58-N1)-methyltransferase
MYETLMRPHETNQYPPLKSVREVGEHLKALANKREDRRQKQIAYSRACNQATQAKTAPNTAEKRKRLDGDDHDGAQADDGHKRFKTDEEDLGEVEAELVQVVSDETPAAEGEPSDPSPSQAAPESSNQGILNVSRVFPDVRGHTSYLTFACLIPKTLYGPVDAARKQDETSIVLGGDNIEEVASN